MPMLLRMLFDQIEMRVIQHQYREHMFLHKRHMLQYHSNHTTNLVCKNTKYKTCL